MLCKTTTSFKGLVFFFSSIVLLASKLWAETNVPQGPTFRVLHSVVLQMQYCVWNVTPCSLAEISVILEESSATLFCFEEGGSAFPLNVGKFIADCMVSCKKAVVFLLTSHWSTRVPRATQLLTWWRLYPCMVFASDYQTFRIVHSVT